MALTIVALFIFIFGAYSYGYLVMLWLRDRPSVWAPDDAPEPVRRQGARITLAMFLTCTVWFVLHAIIAFRALMGDPPEDDPIDLATLEIVFVFPALIFHAYLFEATSVERPFDRAGRWLFLLVGLYVAGVGMAVYFTAAIFDLIPEPPRIGAILSISIGALFTVMSIGCMTLMNRRSPPAETTDQRRLRRSMQLLFVVIIAAFIIGPLGAGGEWLLGAINVLVRSTPLLFLLVSVYFENRIEFYDLVIKRGVLLMLSLLLTGAVMSVTLGWTASMPEGAARPWMFAVLLLPVAMFMPWLHDRVGRLLDRMWFGREFAPVDAVKHVLSAMQAATDEPTLVTATEAALSEIFRRRIGVLRDHDASDPASTAVTIRTASGTPVRFISPCERGQRPLLSEDLALLRSLAGVFGYMLENVRLQRKRQEQEQIAQQLRLQSSRSELKALRAQINPHFLFNALNAIASLIHTDPARADAAVEQLAEIFRYTLRRSEQDWAPLDQELSFARAYLDVEQARFGRRLEFSITSHVGSVRAHVPSMLLQTLVENAVKHGISRLRGPGRIDITASNGPGILRLEVRDTGPGPEAARDTETRPGEGFGLRSVRDRLRGYFGDKAALDLRRDGQTTVATIELPLIEDLSPATGVAT